MGVCPAVAGRLRGFFMCLLCLRLRVLGVSFCVFCKGSARLLGFVFPIDSGHILSGSYARGERGSTRPAVPQLPLWGSVRFELKSRLLSGLPLWGRTYPAAVPCVCFGACFWVEIVLRSRSPAAQGHGFLA